jgi:type II secretory pathway component GspD/PulD (secretin)
MPGLGLSLVGMNVGSQVVSARLRALLDEGEATVRTRPIAVALNKTRTQIMAADEIPYQDARTNVGLDVKFEKVGVKMSITPEIVSLRPGVATLEVANLEVSSVANFVTTANTDRPIFNRSHTNTKVTLAEGETFVVGGLKTRRSVTYKERIPILGSIPLVGLLFSSQSTVERNRDVLFFITPSILAPGENFLLPYDFKNQQALGIDVKTNVAEK